jgi:hypothetical protein
MARYCNFRLPYRDWIYASLAASTNEAPGSRTSQKKNALNGHTASSSECPKRLNSYDGPVAPAAIGKSSRNPG